MGTRLTSGSAVPRRKPALGIVLLLAFFAAAVTLYLVRRASPGGDADSTGSAGGSRHIYAVTGDPHEAVAAGLAQAGREHKRLLLDFGGDWCADCVVLDFYLHQSPNADLLMQNFVLVHVYIGERIDQNLDIPARYNVAVSKGVPALAVLDAEGNVLYSQTTGEFSHVRAMDPSSVTEFLTRWKA